MRYEKRATCGHIALGQGYCSVRFLPQLFLCDLKGRDVEITWDRCANTGHIGTLPEAEVADRDFSRSRRRRRWFFKNRDKLISGYFLFITCHPFLFDSGLSFNILTATQLALEVGVAFAGSFLLWAPPKWVSLRILLRLIVYPGLPYFLSTDIFSTAKFLSAIFALPLFLACKMESYMLNRYRQIAPHRHDVGDVLDAFVERKATGRNCVWLLNELRFLCRIARHASLVCTYRLVLLMEDLVEYFGEIFLNFSLGIGQLSECFTQLGELVSRRSA